MKIRKKSDKPRRFSRKHGFQWPPSRWQVVAWIVYAVVCLLYYGVICSAFTSPFMIIGFIITGSLIVLPVGLSKVAITLADPSIPLLHEAYYKQERCPFTRTKTFPSVLDRSRPNAAYCHICRHTLKYPAHHCRPCNKCVPGHDHHCCFLNTCIGRYNEYLFAVFLVITLIGTAYVVICSVFVLSLTKALPCALQPRFFGGQLSSAYNLPIWLFLMVFTFGVSAASLVWLIYFIFKERSMYDLKLLFCAIRDPLEE